MAAINREIIKKMSIGHNVPQVPEVARSAKPIGVSFADSKWNDKGQFGWSEHSERNRVLAVMVSAFLPDEYGLKPKNTGRVFRRLYLLTHVRTDANIMIVKREIILYETKNGKIPVKDFLDELSLKQVKKIIWTLELIKEYDQVPKTYFKKLENTDDIWEVRIKLGSDIFRIFSFWDKGNLVVLTHGIVKKTQKTPKQEIKLAENYKDDYFRRKK